MIHHAIQLRSKTHRDKAQQAISDAPNDSIVIIKDVTRSLEQNAKFHALCGDASQKLMFLGRKLTLQQWKVLFISGHAIATGAGSDVVPGLEGEFVNIRESSAQMGVSRMSSLIEYTQAYMDQHEG